MSEAREYFEKACAGDAEAFWRLVLPHRGLVYSVALGMLKDRDRAEDALHDVMVHAFRTVGGLRDPDKLPSWLYSMTRNQVLDSQRRDQRAGRAMRQSAMEARVIPVDDATAKEAELRRMERAMGELPEPFREVLAMKYLNHYPIRQIAEILELTESAVKSRLFQARKSLRRQTEELMATESGPSAAKRETRP